MTSTSNVPPGWFPDPHDTAQLRWWDGRAWSEHTYRAQSAPVPAKTPKLVKQRPENLFELGVRERATAILNLLEDGEIERTGRLMHELDAFAYKMQGSKGVRKAREHFEIIRGGRGRATGKLIAEIKGEGVMGRLGRGASFLPMSESSTETLWVYEDRVHQGSKAHRIDEYTQAQVHLDGQLLVTTRPSLTTMAVLSPLPGSALVPGLARPKKEKTDARVAEFEIASAGWSLSVVISPDKAGTYRGIATRVNAIADQIAQRSLAATKSSPSVSSAPATDVVSQIERIVQLQSSGAITAEQAEALKAQVIAGG